MDTVILRHLGSHNKKQMPLRKIVVAFVSNILATEHLLIYQYYNNNITAFTNPAQDTKIESICINLISLILCFAYMSINVATINIRTAIDKKRSTLKKLF